MMKRVTAAIIEKNGKILIAQRKLGSSLGGKWEFPGGKIESEETPEQCLRRELKEELGIEAIIGPFFCTSTLEYKHMSIELLVYKATHVSGEIVVYDHESIKWVSKDELINYDFVDADRPVVDKLMHSQVSSAI
jgi:8-oxo-dGTP diphosphatase